ncbi:MAG: hypothetical protein IAF94_08965 [Pirellulaceae bacterium]|nr:hypothetical protein [Pirellulaceae bacterium]
MPSILLGLADVQQRTMAVIALLLVLTTTLSIGCTSAHGDGAVIKEEKPAELLSAPEAEELKKATALVSDVFKSDLERAKTPVQKQLVAKKLIQSALDTKDDPLGRFALLRMSMDLAAAGGDLSTATKAIDELARTHVIDTLEMKLEAAELASKLARLPKQHEAYCGDVLPVLHASVSVDRYVVAQKLTALLVRSAKAARNQKLASGAVNLTSEVDELASEHEKLAELFARLKSNTATAADKGALGTFYCFLKGDWKSGLPLLAEGGDGPVNQLAADELSNPTEPEDQLKLADAWWAQAEGSKGLRVSRIRQQAALWYERALPRLSGLSAARAKQHLEVVMQGDLDRLLKPSAAPPLPRVTETIDLLVLSKKLPLDQQAVGGVWSNSKDGIVSGDSAYVRMAFPYRVKRPYELDIELTMLGGKDESLAIILPVGSRQTILAIDGWMGRGYLTYLCNVKGREAPDNRDAVKGKLLKKGKRHAAHLDVSWDDAADTSQVIFTLDGRDVFTWRGKTSDLSPQPGWEIPQEGVIGLGSYNSPTEFSKVVLVEK